MAKQYYAMYRPTPEHVFVPGIPARDLTPVEVAQYGVAALRRSQCYELIEVEQPGEDELGENDGS